MPRVFKTTACNTCRLRKLKCDETLPVCNRCSKAQRYCDRSERPATSTTRKVTSQREGLAPDKNPQWDECPRKALESPQLANYFRHYIRDVALWYDLSDAGCFFRTGIPTMALDEPLLFCAIMALSAMHVSQTTAPSVRAVAETYHGRCVRYLINLGPDDELIETGVALATTCLLRSYEILAEDHDPNRHLAGAFSLASRLRSILDHPDPSKGLLHSGFWNYLREDITFSLFGDCPLKIDLDHIPRLHNVLTDQDQFNAISLILGRIINNTIGRAADMLLENWDIMLSSFAEFISDLPAHFEPFSRPPLASLCRLPTVYMLKACHAAARHYCLVSLAILAKYSQTSAQVDALLSVALSRRLLLGNIATKEDVLEKIGLEICGIAFTSDEPAVLVNAFGPISYCAKFIRTEAAQQEVIGHLIPSRKTTGWPVQKVISDLRLHSNWTAARSAV